LSDETQVETKVEPTVAAAPVAAAAPKQAAQPPRALDKLAQRRLEVKKQKRKAHRHKINASNTPG
jgi:phage tail sheath gpL-like